MKNCDLGLENAALGLQPWAAFSRPRSQFFTIRTSQPANNICLLNSQPRIMQFQLSDWLSRSRLSAIIPVFDLIWETSAASAAQFKHFPAGKRKFHQKNGKFGEVYKLIQEIIDSARLP